MKKICETERIFCPEVLAIFGVSATNVLSFGTMFLKANIDSGFEGKIYPISPKGGEIFGRRIYKNLDEIDGKIDLATIAVPAANTVETLNECLKRKIPAVQIISAGFGEMKTDEGKNIEKEIAAFADKGIRIIGPNCFGIYCSSCGLTILPGSGFPKNRGTVAFFGQSGGMAVDLGYSSPGLGFGWRRMISYGNACDIGASELLRVFADDDKCEIVTAYIEGVSDGRDFFESLKYAAAKKPTIIWKAGLSESGSKAVMSHTGSLGGSREIWLAAVRQAGAVVVASQEELLDTIVAFRHIGKWTGKGIAIVGGGGALGVAGADTSEEFGMSLPAFSQKTKDAMSALLPPVGTSFNNPADVGNPMVQPHILGPMVELAANDPAIDAVILIQIIHHMTYITRLQMGLLDKPAIEMSWHKPLAEILSGIKKKTSIPILQVVPPISSEPEKLDVEGVVRIARLASHEAGVPCYPTLHRALRALKNVSDYWNHKSRHEKKIK